MKYKISGSVALVGDIHGEYDEGFVDDFGKVADNYIFLGDIGFGFEPLKSFIRHLDQTIPADVECYFIRGNHDNPACWLGEKKKLITSGVPRFHIVKDYDTIECGGKRYLCVGGGISIDRFYRIAGQSYWPNEAVLPCPKKNVFGRIDGILSHTGFTPPVLTHKHNLQIKFPDVNKDCEDEQKVLYDILHLYNPKVWYCGHYHVSCKYNVEDCKCTALDCHQHFLLV